MDARDGRLGAGCLRELRAARAPSFGHEAQQGAQEPRKGPQGNVGLAGQAEAGSQALRSAQRLRNLLWQAHRGRDGLRVVPEHEAEVDVEEEPPRCDHDILEVAVADAEHVGDDATRRHAAAEVVEHLVERQVGRSIPLEPGIQRAPRLVQRHRELHRVGHALHVAGVRRHGQDLEHRKVQERGVSRSELLPPREGHQRHQL
mmetsp:Transcript_83478/g.232898  ORF Transcript_83478/g.232898 Transcript_83478/m.232898 type:complete len:202 (+) Transcript_83478:233-838(+)